MHIPMPKKPPTPPPAPTQPPEPRRRSLLPFVGIVAVLAIVAGYYWYERSIAPGAEAPATSAAAPVASPAPAAADVSQPNASTLPAAATNQVPASAKFGPHTQDTYPPLPDTGFSPPRPMETVRAVYQFAAEHPEVLSYIPCYCGCDRQGHKGNDDCFVAERNPKGDVVAWDQHGMT